MNTNDIRQMIKRAIDQEGRTSPLRSAFASTGLTGEAREQLVSFISAYVSETPDLLDAAFNGARAAGVSGRIQPLFDAAFGYWARPLDFIPDHVGLLGLTDDAYLSRRLMERVSAEHERVTGRRLFDAEFERTNTFVRNHVIGEPIATKLDDVVRQTQVADGFTAFLEMLFGMEVATLQMFGYNNYAKARLESARIDREVETRLGAMGIF